MKLVTILLITGVSAVGKCICILLKYGILDSFDYAHKHYLLIAGNTLRGTERRLTTTSSSDSSPSRRGRRGRTRTVALHLKQDNDRTIDCALDMEYKLERMGFDVKIDGD